MDFENLRSLAVRSARYLDAAKDNLKVISAGVYEGGRTLVKSGMAAFEEEVQEQRRRNAARAGQSPANEDPAGQPDNAETAGQDDAAARPDNAESVCALKAKLKSLEGKVPAMALLQEYQYLRICLQEAKNAELKKVHRPDDVVKEPELVYEVLTSGYRRYKVLSTIEILAMNFDLLTRLRTEMQADDEYFDRIVLPLIARFTDYVSIVPASEGNHDIHPGGLVHHSLLCCLEAQCTIGFKDAWLNCREFRLLLFARSLLHDIAKLQTDLKICSPAGEFYLVEKEPLSAFIARTGSDHLLLTFRPERYGKHDKGSDDKTALINTIQQPLLPELKAAEHWLSQLSEQQSREGIKLLQTITSNADGSAVRFSRADYCNGLYFTYYVFASVYEYLQKISFNGCDLQHGLFWTSEGVIVSTDSPLLDDLVLKYNSFFDERGIDDENAPPQKRFLDELRRSATVRQPGLFNIRYWHKIFAGPDLIFVNGIAFILPNMMKTFPFACEMLQSVGRSTKPPELEPVLEVIEHDKCKLNIIVLKNAALPDAPNMLHNLTPERIRTEFIPSADGVLVWTMTFPDKPHQRADIGIADEGSRFGIAMRERPLLPAAEPYYYCRDDLPKLSAKAAGCFETETALCASPRLLCGENRLYLIDECCGFMLMPVRDDMEHSSTVFESKAVLIHAENFEGDCAAAPALFKAEQGSLLRPAVLTNTAAESLSTPETGVRKNRSFFNLPGCAACDLKADVRNFIENVLLTCRPESRVYVFPTDDPLADSEVHSNASIFFNYGYFVEPYYYISIYLLSLRIFFRCSSDDFELGRGTGRILQELHEIFTINPSAIFIVKRKRTIKTPTVNLYAGGRHVL